MLELTRGATCFYQFTKSVLTESVSIQARKKLRLRTYELKCFYVTATAQKHCEETRWVSYGRVTDPNINHLRIGYHKVLHMLNLKWVSRFRITGKFQTNEEAKNISWKRYCECAEWY